MLRVARLHVSFLQLLEECPLAACIRRPSIDQSSVEPLGLSAQEADIMHMRRIEGADQQNTVVRSEEHTSELQSLMRNSYAVFCLKKKKNKHKHTTQESKRLT